MEQINYKLLIIIIGIAILFSCRKEDKKATPPVTAVISNNIKLDEFSDFPPEIDGCACTYAKDSVDLSSEKYIYVSNHAKIAFLKINGVLTKFTLTAEKRINSTDFIKKYISTNYKLIILIKAGRQTGDESWLNTGLIKIFDKNGKTISQTFYGECGC